MNNWSSRLGDRFRRVTSGGTFVPEIDGLRFAAIASVVAFHLYGQLIRYYGVHLSTIAARLLHNGDRGVRLFFVISGFILARPFASYWLHGSPPVNLKRYFGRRLTRLEPPYVLNLVVCAVLLIAVNHVPPSAVLPHLLSSLFYIHNAVYGNMSTINPVAWSLEIEVQFYLLMPLLAFVFALRAVWLRRGLLVAAMLIVGLVQVHWAHTQRIHLTIAYYIQYFLAGLILADLQLQENNADKQWRWDILSIVGWPTVFVMGDMVSHITLPFLVLALYWAAFHGKLTNHVLRLRLLTAIGGMCYTIYLFHFLIIAFATRMLRQASPLLLVAVSISLIAIASTVYFLLIERPCMDRNWPGKLAALLSVPRKQMPVRASASF